MVGILALGLIVFGGFGYIVEHDIVQLSMEQPTITVPTSHGRVAGVSVASVGQATMIIDAQSGDEPLEVEFPVLPNMTVMDALERIAQGFDLALDTRTSPVGSVVKTIGTETNGTDSRYWQYSIDHRTPLEPINARIVEPGDVIQFAFVQQFDEE